MKQECIVLVLLVALANANHAPAQAYGGQFNYGLSPFSGGQLNYINGCAILYVVDADTSYVSYPGTNTFEQYYNQQTPTKFTGLTFDSEPICAINQFGQVSEVFIRFGEIFGRLYKIGVGK